MPNARIARNQVQFAQIDHFEQISPDRQPGGLKPIRVGAVQDQIRHPMNECLGLARARAGRDQQRRRRPSAPADSVFDRAALRRIQFAQILVAIDVCQRPVKIYS